ncbi:alpha-1,3-mannosyl-glycoprotein 4-beta-N-acetylglucosaminyltransferase-like protein MGAT4E isoform X2 [Fukomys damarensis]|uniref:alpha-1,3-mannosyl-glycoprotein 4-beta-N-acetylglucosaminyltransferase-like protein MGAT4E isoform X2 n=1 Tax=Fukomys damarensis TaxID=885580 RepID=UPI00054014FD|nr:alpha-1,3-mannosyl-glycoprotein 4-beta-N-acetylglucosaminyltransferase-like protein MGAT4E isoform X2 [Fukomys damarensis]
MRFSSRSCFAASAGIALLWLFITLQIPRGAEDGGDVMPMKGRAAPRLAVGNRSAGWGWRGQPQETSYDRKNPRPLEDWHAVTFKYTQKIPKRRRTWLTVGISTVSRQDPSSLLYTLASLYNASSTAEQKRLTVLVHLADSDLAWLKDTTARISSLFSSQILAGQLLLIHAPPAAYPTVNGSPGAGAVAEADHGKGYSKQNVDHAFLMSFAAKLSDYFLLIGDTVFCAPNFVTHIYSKVTALKPSPWVLLEFSNVGLIGKLFHSRDLPALAHFLLLFHKEKPLDKLILHFRTLLVQENPILCRPFLFYHRSSRPTFDGKEDTVVQKKNPYGPSNPPASVFTDMNLSGTHFPWEAYALDESFFWTNDIRPGNHLTVVLNHPARLSRVQVMTGSIVEGKFALSKGQVQLGYDPQGMPQDCASSELLGWLVEGQMDREIPQESASYPVSCVRLVVKARQAGGLMIRHIYLWEKDATEEKKDQGRW